MTKRKLPDWVAVNKRKPPFWVVWLRVLACWVLRLTESSAFYPHIRWRYHELDGPVDFDIWLTDGETWAFKNPPENNQLYPFLEITSNADDCCIEITCRSGPYQAAMKEMIDASQ